MLPREHRIRKQRELQRLQHSPAVFRRGLLVLRVVRRGDSKAPRAVIAVGRHVSKRAVDRNQTTRWLREALRREMPKVQPGVDLRLSVAGPFARVSYHQWLEGTRRLLERAGLLRGG